MKSTIIIFNDNPEKNKIGVKKYIKRKIYNFDTMPYIKYNHNKWYIRYYGKFNNEIVYSIYAIKTL